jgi:hypothetical protein
MTKPFLKIFGPSERSAHGIVEVSAQLDRMPPKIRLAYLRHVKETVDELVERTAVEIDGVRLTDSEPNPQVIARIVRRA